MTHEFTRQLMATFYQWSSFQVGSFNIGDAAANLQNAFLGSSLVYVLQIISGILTIGLAIAVAYLSTKRKEFNQKIAAELPIAAEALSGTMIQNQWADVMTHIESTQEGEWKFAIIEADKIVDHALKNYFPGDTMGERLMNIDKTKLLSIDGLWEAHKMRNRLAHEPNYFLRHAEALRAVQLFEATLKELEVL